MHRQIFRAEQIAALLSEWEGEEEEEEEEEGEGRERVSAEMEHNFPFFLSFFPLSPVPRNDFLEIPS